MKKLILPLILSLALTTPVHAATKYHVSIPKTYDTIIVGDSRTVGTLQIVSANNVAFICEVGQGYNWLKDKAQYDVKKYAKPNCKVVFNLGVNDIKNVDKYLELYTELSNSKELQGCALYFETVNPVRETYDHPTNKQINEFNKTLTSKLPSKFSVVDTNSKCVRDGYNTTDGLHYSTSSTKAIFDCLMSELSTPITVSVNTVHHYTNKRQVIHKQLR